MSKPCPRCRESMNDDAYFCGRCRYRFPPWADPSNRLILMIFVGIVFVGMILSN